MGIDWIASSSWRAFLLIFLLCFGVQGFFLTKVPHRYIQPHTRWEIEAVAVSLVQTGQFANPYDLPTGPTAHLPPIPPFLLSLIYRLFGLTLAAGYVSWLLRMATYSVMYAMLPWLAGKFGAGRQAGLLGGIAGALTPQWPGYGEALTAIVLGLLLLAFLRRWTRARSTARSSVLLGLAWGAAFHLQPVLLTVLLGCIAFELWWSAERRKWRLSGVMVLGVLLACVPWGWRNYTTFGEVFFIRSNLGLELRMGNHEGAEAAMDVMDIRQEHIHPRTHREQARKLQEIGEAEYMRQAKLEALQWIRTNPGTFLRLTASRFVHFWFGPLHAPPIAALVTVLTVLAVLGTWRIFPALTVPQRAVFLIPLAAFPLVYYIVAYMLRYTEPVRWILLLLAGAEVWHWIKRR